MFYLVDHPDRGQCLAYNSTTNVINCEGVERSIEELFDNKEIYKNSVILFSIDTFKTGNNSLFFISNEKIIIMYLGKYYNIIYNIHNEICINTCFNSFEFTLLEYLCFYNTNDNIIKELLTDFWDKIYNESDLEYCDDEFINLKDNINDKHYVTMDNHNDIRLVIRKINKDGTIKYLYYLDYSNNLYCLNDKYIGTIYREVINIDMFHKIGYLPTDRVNIKSATCCI